MISRIARKLALLPPRNASTRALRALCWQTASNGGCVFKAPLLGLYPVTLRKTVLPRATPLCSARKTQPL